MFNNFHLQLTLSENSEKTLNFQLWEWIKFDKVETEFSRFQKSYLVISAISLVIAIELESNPEFLINNVLNIVNFYRIIFTYTDVANGLKIGYEMQLVFCL